MGMEKPSSTLNHLNAAFDPDMERYLDLDLDQTSEVSGPSTESKVSPGFSMGSYGGESEQIFPGPSFQYDSYKQQTGLPTGGLADTFALNKATGMQYTGFGGSDLVMPMDTLNMPLSTMDDFDFAAYTGDMDMEADSPTDNSFYSNSSSKGSFVDPNALVGRMSSNSTPVQRMYPGMHSQLAAQAKAQQAQKQAAGQQPRPLPQGQKPLPATAKTPVDKDPVVEESISRLLNQMRNNSVGSGEDDSATPTANIPHLARMKKDEDDMDEDERLLASEEGKKLSSKERRQLRNKVSARAFRSRRKGLLTIYDLLVVTVANSKQNTLVNSKAKWLSKCKKPQISRSKTDS